jgi:hypothetical protein
MNEDGMVTCRQCDNFRNGKCQQARAAGLSPWASIEIGTTLAQLPQRCPAFKGKQ